MPYELKGKTFAQIRGEFEKETGNPKVSVPTIKVGDEWVTDSWKIAEWVSATQFPTRGHVVGLLR